MGILEHIGFGIRYTPTDLSGKNAVVTGANVGVGLETARGLVEMGAHVILGCRTEKKALDAVEDINNKLPTDHKGKAEYRRLDLASFSSIDAFVEAHTSPIDILVLNAAIITTERTFTEDKNETMFQVNSLAHSKLVKGLFKFLHSTSRIIFVSTDGIYLGDLTAVFEKQSAEDLVEGNILGVTGSFKHYTRTKYLSAMWVAEFSRKIEHTGIKVHQTHPGFVNSDMPKKEHNEAFLGKFITYPIQWVSYAFGRSPSQGAVCSLHVATCKEAAETTNGFWRNCVKYDIATNDRLGEKNQHRAWNMINEKLNLREEEGIWSDAPVDY